MLKNILVTVVVASLVALGFLALLPRQVVNQFGAAASPDHTNLESFFGGMVVGHPLVTISAAATATTLTSAQVCPGSTILQTPAGNATFTLPTTVLMGAGCLKNIGDSVTVQFRNASSAGTFAVATSTGQTMYHVSGTTAYTVASATPLFVTITMTGTSTSDVFFDRYLRP